MVWMILFRLLLVEFDEGSEDELFRIVILVNLDYSRCSVVESLNVFVFMMRMGLFLLSVDIVSDEMEFVDLGNKDNGRGCYSGIVWFLYRYVLGFFYLFVNIFGIG